jgi:hypothetical protein
MSETSQRAGALNDALFGAAQAVVPSQPTDFLPGIGPILFGSGESEAAFLPKNASMPSGVIAQLKKAFADDPALYKYAAHEYGRVGDRAYGFAIEDQNAYQYAKNILNAASPSKLPQGTPPKEASKISNELARTKFRFNRPAQEEFSDLMRDDPTGMQRFYSGVKVISPEPDEWVGGVKESLNNIHATLIDAGIDPKKLPIDRRFEKAKEIYEKGMTLGTRKTMDLGGGSKIVELVTPQAFTAEGKRMGNSVGGYADGDYYSLGGRKAIQDGRAKVFSVRDKSGKSTLNIEVEIDPKTQQGTIIQVKQPGNRKNWTDQDEAAIDKFAQETGYDFGEHPKGYGSFNDLPDSIRLRYQDRYKGRIDEPQDHGWYDPPEPDDQFDDLYEIMRDRQGFANAMPEEQVQFYEQVEPYSVRHAFDIDEYRQLRTTDINPHYAATLRQDNPDITVQEILERYNRLLEPRQRRPEVAWMDEYDNNLGVQDFITQEDYIYLRQNGNTFIDYYNNALPNEGVRDFINRTHGIQAQGPQREFAQVPFEQRDFDVRPHPRTPRGWRQATPEEQVRYYNEIAERDAYRFNFEEYRALRNNDIPLEYADRLREEGMPFEDILRINDLPF